MNTPGADLWVPAGPGVPDGLRIAAADLSERFSRSPGPGGQSVNTTDSRVELVFDVRSSASLDPDQASRILAAQVVAGHVVGDTLVVVASEHRSQHRNRIAARQRLADLLRTALAPPPPPRRPTRPTRSAQQRRLDGKRQRGMTKWLRGRVTEE